MTGAYIIAVLIALFGIILLILDRFSEKKTRAQKK